MIETLLSDLVALYTIYSLNVTALTVSPAAVHFLDDCLSTNFAVDGTRQFEKGQITILTRLRAKWNEAFNQTGAPAAASSSPQNKNNDQSLEGKINSLFTLVQNLSAKVNGLDLNKNNNPNNYNERPPKFSDLGLDQEDGVLLERFINSKLRYANHVNSFQTHLNRNPFTCPPSYYSCYFPKPVLWDNEEFVDMHNNRIKSTQKEWMQQDIAFMNSLVDKMEASIMNLKEEITHKFDSEDNVKTAISQVETQVGKHLEPFVKASSEKLNREIKMIYYHVRNNKQNPINNDEANSTNHNNSNVSGTSGKRPSKRRRHYSNSSQSSQNKKSYNYSKNQHKPNYKQSNGNLNKSNYKSYKATDSAFTIVKKVSIASDNNSDNA